MVPVLDGDRITQVATEDVGGESGRPAREVDLVVARLELANIVNEAAQAVACIDTLRALQFDTATGKGTHGHEGQNADTSP